MFRSRTWRRYSKGVLALFFCWSVSVAQAVDFMPVSEVQTGMEGTGRTVITGDTISTFNVKILGVMKDRGPSGDLILAQFSGPVMNQTGGIAQGMSGSPVYINGKLVGAVAYGWGFADGKVGMITPIADMVKLWNIPYEKNRSNPWADDKLIPLNTPLMAYGFDGDALTYMKSKLSAYQFDTYDTAAANGDEKARPLEAGGSVAALLVDGDLKLGAIGTVTYVDGDRIVAFGHPFLKRGAMDYFMHNAYIFTVVKSMNSAFKLGSMGATVGAVTEDRGAGIAGISGRSARAIPVQIQITDEDMNRDRLANVKVIEDDDLTPALAATAVYNFINKTIDRSGAGTAKVTFTLTPRDNKYETLQRTNMFYADSAVSEKSVDELYKILDALMNNSFINYELMDIRVKVDVTKQQNTARITDAAAAPVVVAPGDSIAIRVKLHPFREPDVEKELFFTVPKDQKLGKAILEVRGGGELPLPYLIEKQKYNLTDEIIRRLRNYKDFNEFYKTLKERDQNNQIVAEILDDSISAVDDKETEAKPAELREVEKNPLPSEVKRPEKKEGAADLAGAGAKEKQSSSIDTEYVIQGDGQFAITVMSPADRDKELARRAKNRRQPKAAASAVIRAAAQGQAEASQSGSNSDTSNTGEKPAPGAGSSASKEAK